jgi:hypothetical protein
LSPGQSKQWQFKAPKKNGFQSTSQDWQPSRVAYVCRLESALANFANDEANALLGLSGLADFAAVLLLDALNRCQKA